MPGLTGSPHFAYHRHLMISREATFGVVNPSPSWQVMPILGDGYKLLGTAPRYRPDTNWGGYNRNIAIHHVLEITGSHTMLAWPQCVGPLLHAALDRDGNDDVYSYTHDFFTPADPRRILGAVVASLAINVAGTGDSDVQLATTWRARTETERDVLVAGDYDYSALSCIPFMFRDARIWVDGVQSIDLEAFSITVENAISQGPNRLGRVAYLIAGERTINLDLTRANLDQESRDAIRSGATLSFEANFSHPEGHYWPIQIPVLGVEESDESASRTEVTKEALRLIAANCEGVDIVTSVDLGPTTTTLAPLTTTPGPTITTTPAA